MKTTWIPNKTGPPALKYLSCVLALIAISVPAVAKEQNIRTTVDRVLVNFPDVQPVMINGRVMVPVRGVFEHMNANVVWDANSRTVTAQHGMDSILLPINSYSATVNGREVRLDSPAIIQNGRTIVPLRFLSESLGANVNWVAMTRTVEITTEYANVMPSDAPDYTMAYMDTNTVIPFKLNEKLSSNNSFSGDKFTAVLDTDNSLNYQSMPAGTILEGHVDVARPKTGDTPGVLGLAFDRVRLPDGKTYPIYGSLIGLDSKSVVNENGRLVAKPDTKNDNLKWVGYGAGGGALVAILTDGNVITNALIGGALGFLYGEVQKDPSKSRDVTSEPGTKFGVKLTRDFAFQVPMSAKQ